MTSPALLRLWLPTSLLAAFAWQEPRTGQAPTDAATASRPAADHTVPSANQHQGRQPAATLHQAWLTEVMDLDFAKAAATYREVASDKGPDNPERWVATARLVELQRLGVVKSMQLDPGEIPLPLRAPIAAAQAPIDLPGLMQRAMEDPATLMQGLGGKAGAMPLLRPAVFAAQEWLIGQVGPSWRDSFRQRQQNQVDRGRFFDRMRAIMVVDAELQGRRGQADGLRSLYFTPWQPPAVTTDHAANLARVRANLDALLRGRDVNGSHQLMRKLRETIDDLATTDPAAAMALILRLPYFAETLLQPVPPGDGH